MISFKKIRQLSIISLFVTVLLANEGCKKSNSNSTDLRQTHETDTTLSDTYKKLIDKAKEVRNNAYAPYSKFYVGAAVLGESGNIYVGCNVENASYGLTICAERSAVFQAVSAGEKKIKAIAIVLDAPDYGAPCGACRQVIYEFGKNVDVIMATVSGKYKIEKISNLLPYAFGPENLTDTLRDKN